MALPSKYMLSFRGALRRGVGAAIVAAHTSLAHCGGSKLIIAQSNKEQAERARQRSEALDWSKANGKKSGHAATHRLNEETGERVWPLVSEGRR